ncbi:MAG: hypothetical protein FD170_3205 [Bacteroidetes bacterium]|nr:MAG: hypothetical protein FD170_3205 [Bacteroidota bacterium]
MIRLLLRNLLLLVFTILQLATVAQVSDAELLLQETSVEIGNNRLTKNYYYEIRINNRAGEKYTKISIPYSKLIKAGNIDAFIKDSNGLVVKRLKKSEIVEKSLIAEFSFYEDDFVKEFTLKHNSYPYSIVYSYQIQQQEFLYIDDWVPIIDEKVPTLNARLKVLAPLNYNMTYVNRFVKEPEIDTVNGNVLYQWQASYTDLIKPEVWSPAMNDLFPAVAITPEIFSFEEQGSLKDWISYGNWEYNLLKGLNEIPDTEKSKITSLIKDIHDEKEKIKTLFHYLQDETRYINITIGTGGLKPYPAAYVAQNKYGDCKALTNYFKAVLEYVGIKSYYTNVHAGNPVKTINRNFPSQQFNHVILFVPLKDEDLWLDCTSDGPFDYLGTFTQNRDVLVIDHNKSYFDITPALQPADVLETRRIEIEYGSREAKVNFRGTYKGNLFETLQQVDKDFSSAEKSRIVRNFLVEDGLQLNDYQITTHNRDSLKIELAYQAVSQQIYKHYGNDILAGNIAFPLLNPGKPKDRKLPVQIDYPVYKIDTLIYQIPTGYKFSQNFKKTEVSGKYGNYSFNVFEENGKLVVVKSLLVFAGNYPVSEYEDFYRFYDQITATENKTHFSFYK